MSDLQNFAIATGHVLNFLSDLLTVVVASVTLWGIYAHRDDINALFKFARNRRRSQLVTQARSCLRAIEDANSKKTGRDTAVHHSLGELGGLLRNLHLEFAEFENPSKEVNALVDNGEIPAVAIIKRLTTEISGLLDRSVDTEFAIEKDDP